MDTKYKPIKPEDVYYSIVEEELTNPKYWQSIVSNEYGNYPSGNNFIDLFAALVREHGYRPVKLYARLMGVEYRHLVGAIYAMTGMEPRQWIHEYLNLAVCELIEKTNWTMKKIAQRFNFSQVSFSRFFRLMNKCTPYEWMTLKRYGKKISYHTVY
jgi:AraC-type DNA-binding domain-containing proteins